MLKNIFYAAIVTILFFVLAEGVLRMLWHPSLLIAGQVKVLTDNWKDVDGYADNKIVNSIGLRGVKDTLLKNKDIYRVVCLGDSWTFGLNVPMDQSYPALLESFLKRNMPGKNIEVVNAGIPGCRLDEMRHYLEKYIDLLAPDCLIILGGKNGVVADERSDYDRPFLRLYSSPIGSFLANSYVYNALAVCIDKIQHAFYSKKAARRKRGANEIGRFVQLVKRLHGEGREVVLLNYPEPRRVQGAIYDMYQDEYKFEDDVMQTIYAKGRHESLFIDLFKTFQGISDCNTLFLSMYYVHPNEKGYRVFADVIGEALIKEVNFSKGQGNIVSARK